MHDLDILTQVPGAYSPGYVTTEERALGVEPQARSSRSDAVRSERRTRFVGLKAAAAATVLSIWATAALAGGGVSADCHGASPETIPIRDSATPVAEQDPREEVAALINEAFALAEDEVWEQEQRILAECRGDLSLLAELALTEAEWAPPDVLGAAARLYFSHEPPSNWKGDLVNALIGHKRSIIRHGVVLGLAESGDENLLQSFTTDENEVVREEALDALDGFS